MRLKYYVIECIRCKKIYGCGIYKFEPDDLGNVGKKLCGGIGCNHYPISCELVKNADIHKNHPGLCNNCERIMREMRENVVAAVAKE